jgi:poly-gamma-glutamate capsule biosynthesis protein CapA/YwtB (metallophosphatase superfamily)
MGRIRLHETIENILLTGIVLGLFSTLSDRNPRADDSVMTLNIGGDVLLDRGMKPLINMVGVEALMTSPSPLFRAADFTMINLECPATFIEAPAVKKYVFRADPSLLSSLKSIGVTHANLANNHILDQGMAGFIDTIENVTKEGMVPVGVVKGGSEEILPVILEKDGVKVVVFSMNMVEIETEIKKSGEIGPCEVSTVEMYGSVRSFHHAHPERHVIVFLHWGKEYSPIPTEDQSAFAHSLIDAGAEAVIGCHPHAVQSLEIYHGRPIVYSLGNLLFDQDMPETQRGLIITLTFEKRSLICATLHQMEQIRGAPHLVGENRLDLGRDKVILPSGLLP